MAFLNLTLPFCYSYVRTVLITRHRQNHRKASVFVYAGRNRLAPVYGAELDLRHVQQRLLPRHHPGHAAYLGNFDIHKNNNISTYLQGIQVEKLTKGVEPQVKINKRI